MKHWFRVFTIIIIFTLMFTIPVKAASPYKGYTYDQWGNAVPAPNGYVPEKFINAEEMGTSSLDSPQDIFVDKNTRQIYIADKGNDRIVVIDERFKFLFEISILKTETGEIDSLRSPSGVFVDDKEQIYIADTKNNRIVKCNKGGEIIKIIDAPTNAAFGKDFEYIPIKVVVDRDELIYVQALNVYQGIICMDQDGDFIQFFGSSKVDVTAQVLFQQMLRKFMTKEQRAGMISFVNTEYSNLYVDKKGFIFAVVSKSGNSLNEIKKINSKGDNVLRVNPYGNSAAYSKSDYGDFPIQYLQDGTLIDTSLVDIHYDETGMISALDASRGRVFVYDDESNLMFVVGTLGDQLGSFKKPVSLEKLDDKMIVLDSETNGITIFKLTEFGENVVHAIELYNDGRYVDSINPWNDVLKQNSNYNLAYDGIGKAFLRLDKYKEAMKYFRLGYDKVGFSKAQTEYVTKIARKNVILVFIIVIFMGAIPFIFPSIVNYLKRSRREMNL